LLKRELGNFARDVKDDRSAILCGYIETNEMDVVPIYDGSEKRRLEVDGKFRKRDSNSISGRKSRPMIRRHRVTVVAPFFS
jgi:hypothetical protein